MFKNKVVAVTGGAQGIGKVICDTFKKQGAHVCVLDKQPNDYFIGDIAVPEVLDAFVAKVLDDHGRIDFLINNACLTKGGIEDCSYEDFNYVLRVGVSAPFMLAKLFSPHFSEGGAIVNISSTRSTMSQANTESYTAAKGGISALTHALAVSLSGRVRVNAINPGWIDTLGSPHSPEDHAQHPAGRVGTPEDVVSLAQFLCSPQAAFITGESVTVDGGMSKLMIYHNDKGWRYSPK